MVEGMNNSIFLIRTYLDDDDTKPHGVFDNVPELYGPWREQHLTNFAICCHGGNVEKWSTPELHAFAPGTTPVHDWDFYEYGFSLGVFSPAAVKVFAPFFEDRFEVLPCSLDGGAYFCVRCLQRCDFLDQQATRFHYRASPPHELAYVENAVFRKDIEVPVLFAVPEDPRKLFCTDPVPAAVAAAGLRGFDFERCE